MPRHNVTSESSTGLGSKESKKRKIKRPIWDPNVCYELSSSSPTCTSDEEAICISTLSLPSSPSCGVELLRMASIDYLRKQLTKLRKRRRMKEEKKEMKYGVMVVERWCMRYFLKHVCTEDDDPVIPNPSDDMEIDAGFVLDLMQAGGNTEEEVRLVVKDFYKLCKNEASAISKKAKAAEKTKKSLERVIVVRHKHSYDVMLSKNKKKLLKINPAHYDKLQAMYTRQQHRVLSKSTERGKTATVPFDDVEEFHRRLYCVLARYHSIQGHGFQAACTEHVFEVMHRHFGVNLECFASPLNSFYALHCSSFPDTDACFGSLGSFFNFYPQNGSFEANPPFISEIMLKMVLHIELLFSNANGRLSFIVVVPGWEECEAFQRLSASSFTQKVVPIAQADHGFCDGASHQRRDRYRISPYDTFFFFLQNEKAEEKWPITDTAILELKESMANGVPSPSMQARHDKSGRGTDDVARGVYKGKKSRATGEGVMKRKREEIRIKNQKRKCASRAA